MIWLALNRPLVGLCHTKYQEYAFHLNIYNCKKTSQIKINFNPTVELDDDCRKNFGRYRRYSMIKYQYFSVVYTGKTAYIVYTRFILFTHALRFTFINIFAFQFTFINIFTFQFTFINIFTIFIYFRKAIVTFTVKTWVIIYAFWVAGTRVRNCRHGKFSTRAAPENVCFNSIKYV